MECMMLQCLRMKENSPSEKLRKLWWHSPRMVVFVGGTCTDYVLMVLSADDVLGLEDFVRENCDSGGTKQILID
ncbi:unnamed protein product [Allacma fusca]|uniref:Uncharacterized protein n=1 Tax=Allacma fusca TaxID=39272 RepID=A0A8J2NLL5_9HEXA|nr:unnamed protein product [Allacma fusca]